MICIIEWRNFEYCKISFNECLPLEKTWARFSGKHLLTNKQFLNWTEPPWILILHGGIEMGLRKRKGAKNINPLNFLIMKIPAEWGENEG